MKFKGGIADNPAFQNTLRSAGVQQGLAVQFDADGSARITAAGTIMDGSSNSGWNAAA